MLQFLNEMFDADSAEERDAEDLNVSQQSTEMLDTDHFPITEKGGASL